MFDLREPLTIEQIGAERIGALLIDLRETKQMEKRLLDLARYLQDYIQQEQEADEYRAVTDDTILEALEAFESTEGKTIEITETKNNERN